MTPNSADIHWLTVLALLWGLGWATARLLPLNPGAKLAKGG